MLFNSYLFILLFLPCSVLGYYGLNRRQYYNGANIYLIVMSLLFYSYYNVSYLPIILCSIWGNYAVSKLLISMRGKNKRIILIIGIIANISSLGYYKYYEFFIENINKALHTGFYEKHIMLPLGISFFTFQQVSYLVDSYNGKTREYSFVEYALFVTFFPQLVAGPIVLHSEVIPQFKLGENRVYNRENIAKGLYFFVIGLAKKVLIADYLSGPVNFGYANVSTMTSLEAIIVSIGYTLQLYYDFSGYGDMAVGIGYMFNVRLPQNFNSPYRATSAIDFWDRWHMSLTRFLRQYVYFPLGGSRKGRARTYLNVLIVFFISGLWHGANWTFILWGILHGMINCLNRATVSVWDKVPKGIKWFATFTIVNELWVLFRSDSISDAFLIWEKQVNFSGFSINEAFVSAFDSFDVHLLKKILFVERICGDNAIIWIAGVLAILVLLSTRVKNVFEVKFTASKAQGIATVCLLVWTILSLSGVSEFLYWGF